MKKVLSLILAAALFFALLAACNSKDGANTESEKAEAAEANTLVDETPAANPTAPAVGATNPKTKQSGANVREWKIKVDPENLGDNLQFSIVASPNFLGSNTGYSPRIIIGDTVLRLNDDGTTTAELSGLVDVQCNTTLPATGNHAEQQNALIRALSLGDDGILVQWEHHYPTTETDLAWFGITAASAVVDAKFGCNSILLRKKDGLTYVVLEEGVTWPALCLGKRDFAQVEQLWEEFTPKDGAPSSPEQLNAALRAFAKSCKRN